jgi:predicted nucleic acid-binding protein
MMAYFDTSAVVKLVIPERESSRAVSLWDAAELIVTGRLTYVEARAALAAGRRGNRISLRGLEEGKQALERSMRQVQIVDATAQIVRSAGDLAERHGLRGYDAVHLASALSFGTELTLTTWDTDLAEAGRASGLALAGID